MGENYTVFRGLVDFGDLSVGRNCEIEERKGESRKGDLREGFPLHRERRGNHASPRRGTSK